MKISQLYLSIFCLTLLFPFAGTVQAQNWSTTTSYDYNYTIQFPELPQEVFKNVPEGLKITTYAQSAACTYMTKILVMNSEPKDGDAMAGKTLHAMVTKLGGKVIEEVEWKHGEATGTKATIDVPEKGDDKPQVKVQMHVIVVGEIQYQLVAMGPLDLYEDAVAGHFFETFSFR